MDHKIEISKRNRRRRLHDFTNPIAAAGFVGPYMTLIPPNWPHIEAILPHVDAWAEQMAGSADAAYALLRFAERLSIAQRGGWLVGWIARLVKTNAGEREFWREAAIGDLAAGLLAPLEKSPEATRREIRRLLAVVADAGSLGAREVLAAFMMGRSRHDD